MDKKEKKHLMMSALGAAIIGATHWLAHHFAPTFGVTNTVMFVGTVVVAVSFGTIYFLRD